MSVVAVRGCTRYGLAFYRIRIFVWCRVFGWGASGVRVGAGRSTIVTLGAFELRPGAQCATDTARRRDPLRAHETGSPRRGMRVIEIFRIETPPLLFPLAYTRHEHRQRGFGLCEHLLQHEGGRRSTQRSDPMLPARRPAGKPLGLQWPCTSPTHRLASPSHAPHYSYTEDVVGSPVPQ